MRMKFLVKQLKGTKATAAQVLGFSRRTVERYVAGKLKRLRQELRGCLEREVSKRWQPQFRAKARKKAATTDGLVVSTRARFGFEAAAGTTDDARIRDITQALPPEYADKLFSRREQGATEQQLQQITADGLARMYVRADNSRAHGLGVEFTDVERLDIELSAQAPARAPRPRHSSCRGRGVSHPTEGPPRSARPRGAAACPPGQPRCGSVIGGSAERLQGGFRARGVPHL
ncbi:telomere-protecting terminal protein Tpg [Streptomyces sp. NPDC018584]|uniref:telomere-protecting terminal protein Tpg n=1 Tax=unclassified Streptomyces TaxID=2593676 RepID=UPI0037AC5DF2